MSGVADRGRAPECLEPRVRAELAQLLHAARDALGAACAGIMLLRPDASCVTVEATAVEVQTADRLQDRFGEGPYALIGSLPTLFCADIAADPRWPRWGPATHALGLHSLVCARLLVAGRPTGALTVYSRTPRSFTADAGVTHLFARQAAVTLAHNRGFPGTLGGLS